MQGCDEHRAALALGDLERCFERRPRLLLVSGETLDMREVDQGVVMEEAASVASRAHCLLDQELGLVERSTSSEGLEMHRKRLRVDVVPSASSLRLPELLGLVYARA